MKPVKVGMGRTCPKCKGKMGRFEHKPEWRPKPKQPYYFKYWDKCGPCKRMQHYEEAKTSCHSAPPAGPLQPGA